jgi:hypothetical protein
MSVLFTEDSCWRLASACRHCEPGKIIQLAVGIPHIAGIE